MNDAGKESLLATSLYSGNFVTASFVGLVLVQEAHRLDVVTASIAARNAPYTDRRHRSGRRPTRHC